MKVITSQKMQEIEKKAYEEGADPKAFMEKAGEEIARFVEQRFSDVEKILLLVGKGNNGGDALVAGRFLLEKGFQVEALFLYSEHQSSPLNQENRSLFFSKGGAATEEISPNYDLILDGILGTGFHGQLDTLAHQVISKVNVLDTPVIAIDVPSGINGTSGLIAQGALFATQTLFLGLPKAGAFMGEAWEHIGEFFTLSFGLSEKWIESLSPTYQLYSQNEALVSLPKIKRIRHKYQAGYVVGLGGSPGMPGAPQLASLAALRSGAGIVRLLHPHGMEEELSSAPVELVRQGYQANESVKILQEMGRASSLFIGPGMGVNPHVGVLLKEILLKLYRPVVIDADALTLLSHLDVPIPKEAILTPHYGEIKRLLALEHDLSPQELIAAVQNYVDTHKTIIVLKGAPTFVFHPESTAYILPYGDPGMATAGSGDVLTGIIAALLAQLQDPLQAALLGVYIHQQAGQIAAHKMSSYSMVATDIVEALPKVFKQLSSLKYHCTNRSSPSSRDV